MFLEMDFTQREKEAAHDKAQMRRIRAFAVSAFAGDKLPKRNDMLPNTNEHENIKLAHGGTQRT